MFVAVIGP